MTPNEKALAALEMALTRLTELSYRVPNDLWNDDWVAIQTALPEAIVALSVTEPVTPVGGEVVTPVYSGKAANEIQAVFIRWADAEGFGDWLNGHQVVMRNLSRYLAHQGGKQ